VWLSGDSAGKSSINIYPPLLPSRTQANSPQYWDWGRWAQDPENSPIFDGSDTSLSGNGEYIPGHRGSGVVPAGNGGGCVKTGPFKE